MVSGKPRIPRHCEASSEQAVKIGAQLGGIGLTLIFPEKNAAHLFQASVVARDSRRPCSEHLGPGDDVRRFADPQASGKIDVLPSGESLVEAAQGAQVVAANEHHGRTDLKIRIAALPGAWQHMNGPRVARGANAHERPKKVASPERFRLPDPLEQSLNMALAAPTVVVEKSDPTPSCTSPSAIAPDGGPDAPISSKESEAREGTKKVTVVTLHRRRGSIVVDDELNAQIGLGTKRLEEATQRIRTVSRRNDERDHDPLTLGRRGAPGIRIPQLRIDVRQ